MPSGKLVVQRTSPQDIGIRDLYIHVDDRPEFNLKYNQTVTLELEPGHHTIKATNRLFSKRDAFQVLEEDTITYQVCNEASGCIMSLIWGIGMPFYKLTMKRMQST